MTIRLLALAGIVASILVGLGVARPDSIANACGEAGPYDFDTFEVEKFQPGYAIAIELATSGKAVTSTYAVGNETIDLRYQGLKSGPRTARLNENTTQRIPPAIYKSIIWVESNWSNASATVPYGGVGPVIRSFDCGYGLGQVTSGMGNTTGTASARQAAIGSHYLANLSEGVRIFAEKWNQAPKFRPIAGAGNPAIIEDWYFAIWSYNGFAFSNHPLNPLRDPLRGGTASPIYHCQDPAAPSYQATGGSPMFGYGDYTYPERVYGCMQYPPMVRLDGAASSVRLYPKQDVNMPDFTIEAVAKAFETKNFTECEAAGFTGGCPLMDFPTAIPDKKITPHADNTPLVDPSKAQQILASPVLAYTGPTSATLNVAENGNVGAVQVSVSNIGTGIGTFRIRSSKPWLVARHAGDAATRTMDGGVAVGSEIEVVTQAPRTDRPRLFQNGYTSTLSITVLPSLMSVGQNSAVLYIEPLMANGEVFTITVNSFRPEIISIPTPTPTKAPTQSTPSTQLPSPTPTSTPTPDPYPFKAVAPNINKQ